MPIYKGTIEKVGEGAQCTFSPSSVISVIEIGGESLRNIRVSPLMATYLKDSIGRPTEVAIIGKWLCAIKLARGKVIADDTINKHLLMIITAWGVLTIPLFGVGLIFVGISVYKYIRISKQRELVAQLAG